MGNSKRAKVPSSPKGKLGCVHSRNVNTTHTLSEQNSLKRDMQLLEPDIMLYRAHFYVEVNV